MARRKIQDLTPADFPGLVDRRLFEEWKSEATLATNRIRIATIAGGGLTAFFAFKMFLSPAMFLCIAFTSLSQILIARKQLRLAKALGIENSWQTALNSPRHISHTYNDKQKALLDSDLAFGTQPPPISREEPSSDMKTCPDCAEKIMLEARVCRYCRRRFTDEDIVAARSSVAKCAHQPSPVKRDVTGPLHRMSSVVRDSNESHYVERSQQRYSAPEGGIFSFNGRYNREKYFWVMFGLWLAALGFGVVFGLIAGIAGGTGEGAAKGVIFITAIPNAVIVAFPIVKRLHDLDRPGYHYWLFLIPFYCIYLYFVLFFKKGTSGRNKYGYDPLNQ